MKLSQFFTGGAMAALAAALAFTAMPAQAQDNDRRGWRTSQSEARSSARAERRTERAARQTQRAERRAERPAQTQRATPQRTERRAQVAQQRSTRDWNRSDRSDNRATRGGWNAGNAPAIRPSRQFRSPSRRPSRSRELTLRLGST